MPTVATRILSGVASITAEDIGKKVGLALISDLFSEPLEFGLQQLFGSATDAQFREVFEKLDQLEHEIESAVGQISSVVEESQLEEEHARIATYYSNLRTANLSASTVEEGHAGAFQSFFSPDTVEVLDQLNRDTQSLRDRLIGNGAISCGYLSMVAQNLCESNSDIYAFSEKMSAIASLFHADLLHATLVLNCVAHEAPDPLHRRKAAELIQLIGGYDTAVHGEVQHHMRDISTFVQGVGTLPFRLRNKATNGVLGRYAEPRSHGASHIYHFTLHSKGEGYYYLEATGANVGIDHYYGRDIRPVHLGDSGHPNHLWRLDPAPSNPTRWVRIVNRATGASLDHYYGRSIKGAPCDEHPNHLWEVLPHKDGNSCCFANCATGAVLGYDKSHGRITAFDSSCSIDVGVYNPSFGPEMMWKAVYWRLVRYGDTSAHNLVNVLSGEAVDHYDGESFRFVGAPSGHPNHLWLFEPTVVGDQKAFQFVRNSATGQVLDHYYGRCLKGAGDSNAEDPHPNHLWKAETS